MRRQPESSGALRTIVHLDADAYFASVEQAADVRLRGKPIAVGGERRGIIASASYEARKFGIHTPMASYRVANPERLPRRIIRLLHSVRRIEWDVCPDEAAARQREELLICVLQPRFNRAGQVWPR